MVKRLKEIMACSSSKIPYETSSVNCSGHGECLYDNGTSKCFCEIRYSGDTCDNPYTPYHTGRFQSLILNLMCWRDS